VDLVAKAARFFLRFVVERLAGRRVPVVEWVARHDGGRPSTRISRHA